MVRFLALAAALVLLAVGVGFLFLSGPGDLPDFLRPDPARHLDEAREALEGLVPALDRDPAGARLDAPKLPDLRRVLVYDPADPPNTPRPGPGFGTWGDLLAAGDRVAPSALDEIELDPDEPINIQFTSGTTGFPKGVLLTHNNILNNGFVIGEYMQFTDADRLCVPVPFYHCFGMVVGNLAAMTHGATVIIPAPSFDPLLTLQTVQDERCTALHAVPTMFFAMLEHPEFSIRNPNKVRALLGVFSASNPTAFHAADGSGYRLLSDIVLELNTLNPQIASRLVRTMSRWRRYDEGRRALMQSELERIRDSDGLRPAFFAACKSSGINKASAATLFMTADSVADRPAMMPICAASRRPTSMQ